MSIKTFNVKCPKCGQVSAFPADVEEKVKVIYKPYTPETKNRIKIKPSGCIMQYEITSTMLKVFIADKVKKLCDAKNLEVPKIELLPIYIEKKKRKNDIQHKVCASFRLAFNSAAINDNKEDGFFGMVGENPLNKKLIIPLIWDSIIKKYTYNYEEIKRMRSSYKTLDELEERHGINDAFLADIQEYTTPRILNPGKNTEKWVGVSIAPENVIRDALTDPETNKVPGEIVISDVISITNGDKGSFPTLKFLVNIYPTKYMNNTDVTRAREMLIGSMKNKY